MHISLSLPTITVLVDNFFPDFKEVFIFSTQSRKRSGVEGLIEIENPNRVSQKSKKVAELDVNAPRELSRRER